MRKVLLFLLALLLTLTGCITGSRQRPDGSEVVSVEPGFIVNVPERGGSYLALEPGISSADEVISVMKKSNLLDPERDPNPYIDVYSDDSILYAFKFLPAVNYDANFWFEGGSQVLTRIDFSVKNLRLDELIAQYGEPDSVMFYVDIASFGQFCVFYMYYDEIQTYVSVWDWTTGMAYRKKCPITEKSEVRFFKMLTESDYREHAANIFYIQEQPPGAGIYPWRGYGNLFDLYPDAPLP